MTEEIVSYRQDRTPAEVKHNTAIKDSMRRGGVLARLSELWLAVLRGAGDNPPLQARDMRPRMRPPLPCVWPKARTGDICRCAAVRVNE